MGEPNVVRTPRVAIMSLYAMGRPASRPASSPRAMRSSIARAASSARSGRKVTIAFTCGFTRCTCAMKAPVASTAERSRRRMRSASERADSKTSALTAGSVLAAVARDAQRAEDAHTLAGVIGGADGGSLRGRTLDMRVARRVDFHLPRDVHVGAEAVPAVRVVELDGALAHHVHGGTHEDERGMAGGRVVPGRGRTHAEDLHAGGDHAVRGR